MEQHTVLRECLNERGQFHATEDDQTANFHAQESVTGACKHIREWQAHCNQGHYDAGELGVGHYGGGNLGQGHHPQRMHGGDRPGPSNGASMHLRGGQADRYHYDSDSDSDSDSGSDSNSESDSDSDSGSDSNSESDSIINNVSSNNNGLHSRREPRRLEGRGPGGRGLPERGGIFGRATTRGGRGVRGVHTIHDAHGVPNMQRATRRAGRGVQGIHTIHDTRGVEMPRTARGGSGGVHTIHDARDVEVPRTTRGGRGGVHTIHDAPILPNVQGMSAFVGEGQRLGGLGERMNGRREGRTSGGRRGGRLRGSMGGRRGGNEEHENRANHGGHGGMSRTTSGGPSLDGTGGGARAGRFRTRPEGENPPPYGEPQRPRRGDDPPSYEESQRQNHSR
ncbi:hypothetical protein MMC29_004512 [Sticta canariensis]|nr:hypothetical protein [Sticta canariensis]